MDKADSMWRSGIFLGMNSKSIDSIISTSNDGIQMARSVRAKPETEAWDIEALGKVHSLIEHIGFPDSEDGIGYSGGGHSMPAANPDRPSSPDATVNHGEPNLPPQGPDEVQAPNVSVHVDEGRVMHSDNEPNQEPQNDSNEESMDVEAIQHPVTPQAMSPVRSGAGNGSPQYSPTSPGGMSTGSRNMDELEAPPESRVQVWSAPPESRVHPRPNSDDEMVDEKPQRAALKRLRRHSAEEGEESDGGVMNLIQEVDECERQMEQFRDEDKAILSKMIMGVDVTEIYSRPRIVKMAVSMGLVGGNSLDLRTCWDLSNSAQQARALQLIKDSSPKVVVGSPPGTKFSIIQNLNRHLHQDDPEWNARFNDEVKKATDHLRFSAKVYKLQISRGRYFVHEHPQSATSWEVDSIRDLVDHEDAIKIVADQCMFGLTTTIDGQVIPAKKPTGFLTNSWKVAERLSKRCDKSHKHGSLMEGRAKKAEEYPDELCRQICIGIKEQMAYDETLLCCTIPLNELQMSKVIGDAGCPVAWKDEQHEDTEDDAILKKELELLKAKDGIEWAADDITGANLDPRLVKAARALEMAYFRSMGVYEKVPKSDAIGHKLIKTRWIDVNKGDASSPEIRSRLVGKEYNDGVDPDLYASTPPLEAMRYLMSQAATSSDKQRTMMINDISRAYFNAKAARNLIVEIPAEDRVPGDEGKVARLKLCLYGTRDAAFQWGERVASHLEEHGFVRGKAFPAIYVNTERDILTMVHGDDYLSVGPEHELIWLDKMLKVDFEVKTKIVGHAPHLEKEAKILNRVVRVTSAGWELEADQRHVELVVEALELENSKGNMVPGAVESLEDDAEELDPMQASRYRSIAAKLNYMAQDRLDLMFSVKELCREMSTPKTSSWRKLIKVGKYVKSNPRVVMSYAFQDPVDILEAYSDANWAGCKQTRKSTSGGVIMAGTHVIKAWAKTQSLVALSSAESEFYATVKAATEAIGILSMMSDFRKTATIRMHVDASAALGVIQRQGIGKIRHLATSALWLQSQQLKRILKFHKILGAVNPADLFTKYVSRELMEQHIRNMSAEFRSGRAGATVQLHNVMRRLRQLKALIKIHNTSVRSANHQVDNEILMTDESYKKFLKESAMTMEKGYELWKHRQCSETGTMRKNNEASRSFLNFSGRTFRLSI